MTERPTAQQVPIIRLELPAALRYLQIISACLAALLEQIESITERSAVSYNVQLAVHEVCTNIVKHAYAGRGDGRIALEVFVNGAARQLTVDVYDTGGLFDASQAAEPDLDEPQVHGYGLFLARQLVDAVQYERIGERNHWHLSKAL